MGVSHTAFACYGMEVELADADDEAAEKLDDIARDLRPVCVVVEYGSRGYGGSGGWVLAIASSVVELGGRGGAAGIRRLAPLDSEVVERFHDTVTVLMSAGKIRQRSPVGWLVGGRVS